MRERTLSSCFLYVKSRLCKTGKNTLKVLLQCISLPGRMEDFILFVLPLYLSQYVPWSLGCVRGSCDVLEMHPAHLGQMVNSLSLGEPCCLFLIPVLHLYEPLFCVAERRAPAEKYLTCKAFKRF